MSHDKMPSLFIGHGNPMNALADNEFTRHLRQIADDMSRPEAILVVSAHWLASETLVLATETPETIHDFSGFPHELYEVRYPAPGSPATAARVHELMPEARITARWGLDHASWAVLRHMWPDADVPTLELSLDMSADPARHWELGTSLTPLRDEGVLVVGSGNIVHSFSGIDWSPEAKPHPWAEEFDTYVADALLRHDADALVDYRRAGESSRRAVPTLDHYLPLLYVAAMSDEGEAVSFPHVGIDMASMSMRCVRFG